MGSHGGRIAVVTGGGRGIGQEYAVALAADGATVVVADQDDDLAAETVKLVERAGGTAVDRHVDIGDQGSTAEFGAWLRREFGAAHILVNNAAIYHSMRTDSQMTVDIGYWCCVFSVNLDGVLLMTQAVAPLMMEGGWGRIVNQASTAAYSGSGGAYTVSKLALIGLTQGFARELGQHGITVTAIAPRAHPHRGHDGHRVRGPPSGAAVPAGAYHRQLLITSSTSGEEAAVEFPGLLTNSRALVVGGGGGGNGRQITRAISAAGANVAVVDLDPGRAQEAAAELTGLGRTAVGLQGDVRVADDIDRVVREAVAALGGLDLLVTVVGGHMAYTGCKPLVDTTDDEWDLIFDVNVRYVFRIVRAVLRQFLAQGTGGTIVSIGSIAGARGYPMSASYGASKAALSNLAQTVAAEYGRRGVRMNVLSCGPILTPVTQARLGEAAQAADVRHSDNIPLGRPGAPEEVAASVLYLASPMSSFVSGQTLPIDGAATARGLFQMPGADKSMAG